MLRLWNHDVACSFSQLHHVEVEGSAAEWKQDHCDSPRSGKLFSVDDSDLQGNLTSLERLYVSNNQITSIAPQIGKLARLEELDLSGMH